MADIELLVKIPEELVNKLDDDNYPSVISWYETTLYDAIKNGTPLPKGHGDLVDRGTYCSALEEKIKDWDVTSTEIHDKIHGISIAYNICNRLIPIIEADKEEQE